MHRLARVALKAVDADGDIYMATLAKVFAAAVHAACDLAGVAADTSLQPVSRIPPVGDCRRAVVMSKQLHVVTAHEPSISYAGAAECGLDDWVGCAGGDRRRWTRGKPLAARQ